MLGGTPISTVSQLAIHEVCGPDGSACLQPSKSGGIMDSKTEMRNTKVLMELEALAEKLGIQVIQERLTKARSGLCRLRDQYMLFIERNLEEEDKVEVMAGALSRFPLDNTQMLPGIRQMLEDYRHSAEAENWQEEECAA